MLTNTENSMKKENTVTVTLRVTENINEYLRVRAFEERTTKSGYVKELIEKDMEKYNEEKSK